MKLDNDSKSEVHEACNKFYQRILETVEVVDTSKYSASNQGNSINRTDCKAKAKEYLDKKGNLYKEVAYTIASVWKCFDNDIEVK